MIVKQYLSLIHTHMNPNTWLPLQDPAQKSKTHLTPDEMIAKNEQELQNLEQGLWDIFSDDELVATTTSPVASVQVPLVQEAQDSDNTPLTQETSTIQSTIPQAQHIPTPQPETSLPVQQSSTQPTIPAPISDTLSSPQTTVVIPVQPQVIQEQPVNPQTVLPVTETQVITPINKPVPPVVQEVSPVTTPKAIVQEQPLNPQTVLPATPNTPVQQSTRQAVVQAGAVAAQTTPVAAATTSIPTPALAPWTPPKTIVKKGSKISPINFAIWCGLFGFLLIWAVAFLLFLALQNPTQFQGIIGIEGIKTGLKLFAWLFFGSLFLGAFVLIIFNLYKLINQKTGGKMKYVIWLIFGGLLLGGTVFGGIVSFNKINEIIQTTGVNNSLLIPYIKFKDAYKPLSDGFPIIAPTKILYGANDTLLTRFLSSNFVNKNINSLKLDCGNNKQILDYSQTKKQFVGECLYMKKGDYTIKFITNISDKATNVTEDIITDLWPLSITTDIALVPSSGVITHNDAYDEIILGKAPTKVGFDSTSVFTDLKLDEYKIQWDLDGDGIFDKKDLTNFSRQFREPKVQSIYYTLPNMGAFGDLVYQIDVRVLQNDVPICTLTSKLNPSASTSYNISTSFDEQQTRINSYMYKIKNLWTNKFIETISNKTTSFDYEFSGQGNYVVYLNYVTEDGKQGTCESDAIEVGVSTFNINYDLQYKWPNDSARKALTDTGIVALKDMTISAAALPIKLLFTINSITPQSPSTKTVVRLDNQIIQTPNGKSYEITLTNSTNTSITITATNPITQATTVLEFPIKITQEDIVWKLTIFPDSVGTSPLDIVLDASTTTLTDKDDEIIYFTWDYGDGEIIQNTSQARTEHTYVYDDKTENGEYRPSVTITTKKWKITKFWLKDPILVKKPIIASRISIDSHPAQIANVGDKVDFSLHTDGTPTHIVWNFWTSEGIECSDRSCASVPMFFTSPWTYTVTATITYKDLNSSSATTKIVVEK